MLLTLLQERLGAEDRFEALTVKCAGLSIAQPKKTKALTLPTSPGKGCVRQQEHQEGKGEKQRQWQCFGPAHPWHGRQGEAHEGFGLQGCPRLKGKINHEKQHNPRVRSIAMSKHSSTRMVHINLKHKRLYGQLQVPYLHKKHLHYLGYVGAWGGDHFTSGLGAKDKCIFLHATPFDKLFPSRQRVRHWWGLSWQHRWMRWTSCRLCSVPCRRPTWSYPLAAWARIAGVKGHVLMGVLQVSLRAQREWVVLENFPWEMESLDSGFWKLFPDKWKV